MSTPAGNDLKRGDGVVHVPGDVEVLHELVVVAELGALLNLLHHPFLLRITSTESKHRVATGHAGIRRRVVEEALRANHHLPGGKRPRAKQNVAVLHRGQERQERRWVDSVRETEQSSHTCRPLQ